MTLLDVYRHRAETTPDEPALVFDRGPDAVTLTWRQLYDRGADVARSLPADARVAVMMRDHVDVLPFVLAVWHRGGVVVPIDAEWGSQVMGNVLAKSGAAVVLDVDGCVPNGSYREGLPPLPDGTAMISYTSGSTSEPKGVVLTHDQLLHAYRSSADRMEHVLGRRPTVFGVSMRMSGLGILGMNYLWPAVMGASVVVVPELTLSSARTYWQSLREHDVDITYVVPALVELLIRTGSDSGGDLIACLSGGAPLSATSQQTFQDRFEALLVNVYGMTEVAFAAFFGDVEAGRGTSSVGVPVTVEARLRSADDTLVVGAGEGELEMDGPSRSCGYYDNDASNAELLRDGWVRSGDIARRDAQGRYWITGRRKDVVLKGGFTVYLHEVEESANEIAGVVESAGVRLEFPTGEDIGLVVHAPGLHDAEAIQHELVARLGRQRAPRRVVLTTDPLQRTGQEKIDRRAAAASWHDLITRSGS